MMATPRVIRSELAADVAATLRGANRKADRHGSDPSPVEVASFFSITGHPAF